MSLPNLDYGNVSTITTEHTDLQGLDAFATLYKFDLYYNPYCTGWGSHYK